MPQLPSFGIKGVLASFSTNNKLCLLHSCHILNSGWGPVHVWLLRTSGLPAGSKRCALCVVGAALLWRLFEAEERVASALLTPYLDYPHFPYHPISCAKATQ